MVATGSPKPSGEFAGTFRPSAMSSDRTSSRDAVSSLVSTCCVDAARSMHLSAAQGEYLRKAIYLPPRLRQVVEAAPSDLGSRSSAATKSSLPRRARRCPGARRSRVPWLTLKPRLWPRASPAYVADRAVKLTSYGIAGGAGSGSSIPASAHVCEALASRGYRGNRRGLTSTHGLARRHRRRRLRRLLRRAHAREASCRRTARGHARQRRQLHALHAAAARARRPARSSRATSSCRCARSCAAPTCASARVARRDPAQQPAHDPHARGPRASELAYDQLIVALGLGLAHAADPGPGRARDRLQDAARGDRAAQPRAAHARGGRDASRTRRTRAGVADVRLRRRRLRGARGARRAAGLRRRRDRALPALPHAGHALGPRRGAATA